MATDHREEKQAMENWDRSRRRFLKGAGVAALGGTALAALASGLKPLSAAQNGAPGGIRRTPGNVPAQPAQATTGTFVGSLADGLIGLTTDGNKLIAYACNYVPGSSGTSAASYETNSFGAWFNTSSLNGGVSGLVANPSGGQLLVGLNGNNTFGVVVNPDLSLNSFTAQQATGSAGLYRATGTAQDGTQFVAGWIVDFQNFQVGSVLNLTSGLQIPAPQLTPDAISARQILIPQFGEFQLLICAGGTCA